MTRHHHHVFSLHDSCRVCDDTLSYPRKKNQILHGKSDAGFFIVNISDFITLPSYSSAPSSYYKTSLSYDEVFLSCDETSLSCIKAPLSCNKASLSNNEITLLYDEVLPTCNKTSPTCNKTASTYMAVYLTSGYEAKNVQGAPVGELGTTDEIVFRNYGKNPGELQPDWAPVAHARNYTVQVFTDTNDPVASLVKEVTVNPSDAAIGGLERGRMMWVRIRANGGSNNHGPWSDPAGKIVP